MALIVRTLRQNLGLFGFMAAGGAWGYVVAVRNLNDVRQVVAKDMLEISEHHGMQHIHVEKKLQALAVLPLRTVSRMFGYVAHMELPGFILRPLLKAYVKKYDVKLDEAVDPDLSNYKSVAAFFNRDIKIAECRQFDHEVDLISPCDGRVLALGRVSAVEARRDHFKVEQVKDVSFSLTSFLGSPLRHFPTWLSINRSDKDSSGKTTDLFFCTIYLAPGDYHGFVVPATWKIFERRHFSGRLFSVQPALAEVIRPLFTLNERVLYTGIWKHGFFSFTAVGATNVGNIQIDFDKELATNRVRRVRPFSEMKFQTQTSPKEDYSFKLGENFGRFRLGSTIVLIFEAPHSMKFNIEPGERVLIGQSLIHKV